MNIVATHYILTHHIVSKSIKKTGIIWFKAWMKPGEDYIKTQRCLIGPSDCIWTRLDKGVWLHMDKARQMCVWLCGVYMIFLYCMSKHRLNRFCHFLSSNLFLPKTDVPLPTPIGTSKQIWLSRKVRVARWTKEASDAPPSPTAVLS